MKTKQELTLIIEDLEERIAPHISVALPDAASDTAAPEGHPQASLWEGHPLVGEDATAPYTLHASLGPEADPFVKPHFR